MSYVPNPQDPTRPTTQDLAGNMAAELQALKGYLQSLVASGSNFANIGGFRNRLKNGAFNVAQRGSSFTFAPNTPGYTVDQWSVSNVGPTGANVNVNQYSGGVNSNNKYLTITPSTSPATGSFALTQILESVDCQDLIAGTTITISGMLSVNNLGANIPQVILYAPTAVDNWTSQVAVSAQLPVNITLVQVNTFTFFSLSLTLTADATAGLKLIIGVNAPGGYLYSFAKLQLEKGSYASSFEYHPYEYDLMQCRRYYNAYLQLLVSCYVASGTTFFSQYTFPQMRAVPTLSFQNIIYSNSSSLNQVVVQNNSFRVDSVATATGICYTIFDAILSAEFPAS